MAGVTSPMMPTRTFSPSIFTVLMMYGFTADQVLPVLSSMTFAASTVLPLMAFFR